MLAATPSWDRPGCSAPCRLATARNALAVRRVHCSTNAVFVVAHVAIGHRDGIDIGINKLRLPRQRVGDAIDVIPRPVLYPTKCSRECADLHQLESRLDLLDEDIDFDRPAADAQMIFQVALSMSFHNAASSAV